MEQAEYPLLSITGVEGIADSGRLNLDGDVLVRFSGYNFSGTSTIDKEYYLVTTENGILSTAAWEDSRRVRFPWAAAISASSRLRRIP